MSGFGLPGYSIRSSLISRTASRMPWTNLLRIFQRKISSINFGFNPDNIYFSSRRFLTPRTLTWAPQTSKKIEFVSRKMEGCQPLNPPREGGEIKRIGGYAGTKCQNLQVLLLPAKGYIISFHPILPSQKRIFIWKTFHEPLLGLFLRLA